MKHTIAAVWLIVSLLCSLTACTSPQSGTIELSESISDTTIPEDTEDTDQNVISEENDDVGAPLEAEDPSDKEDVNDTPGSEADAFSWDDMTFEGEPFLPSRTITREELDATFGKPISVERIDAVNHTIFWEKRQYDGILITCEDLDDADFSVGTVEYQREDLSYVKGVHIGDSMEDVMSVFQNDATDFTPQDTDAGYGVVLYGTPRHMADYGILLYENDKPCQLMYQSQGGGVRLTLDDEGIVVSIEMFGGLHG